MEDLKQVQRKNTSNSAVVVFGIPLLFDRIFKDFPTRDLFTLRSVCKTWNWGALRQLQKREDFTIYLTLTNLTKNDPCCFRYKDRKILLRHVTLNLKMEEEWKVRLRLQLFLQLHHGHIFHLNASTPDFLRDVWNKWTFPKLESLIVPEDFHFDDTPIPSFVAQKATVTKLSLLDYSCKVLGDLLLAATPRLQELYLKTTDPNRSLFTTTKTLKILEFQDFVCWEDAIGLLDRLNAFLRRHGDGLEKLKIKFNFGHFFTVNRIVFEAAMPNLKEVWFGGDAVMLNNFGPAMFPRLESLRLHLESLDENSLANQEGKFEKLTHLSVCISWFDEDRRGKLTKLLSMGETAKNIAVSLKMWFRPLDHSHSFLMNVLNSLAFRGVLKELKLRIQFEVDVDREGVATCTNLEVVDERMGELRSLADNGLERLFICVDSQSSLPRPRGRNFNPNLPFYVGDWGQNFVSEVLNLASRMKHVQVTSRGYQVNQNVFCPALEERLRAAIAENRLPLEVRWTENFRNVEDHFD